MFYFSRIPIIGSGNSFVPGNEIIKIIHQKDAIISTNTLQRSLIELPLNRLYDEKQRKY